MSGTADGTIEGWAGAVERLDEAMRRRAARAVPERGREADALAPLTWHAVHTAARAEWLAADELRALGYAVFYPHFADVARHGRRVIGVLRPLFSRYLFVGISAGQSHHGVNTARGVSTMVHAGDLPLEVPAWVIGTLMARADANGRMDRFDPGVIRGKARAKDGLQAGALARVTHGTLQGLIVEIAAVDDSAAVSVWLRSVGRANQIAIPAKSLDVLVPAGIEQRSPRYRRLAG